jgi:hypothetical protein
MAGPIPIGPYTVGEIPAPIVVTFRDSLSAALDLSNGAWVGRWIYRQHAPGASGDFQLLEPAAITQLASVDHGTGATKGQVTYIWVAADLSIAGNFEGEMWIGNGINRYASERFTWTVRPAISVPSI